MRRMIATCAASFWPKNARSGSTMWNNFATTVVTPRKCPGRERPSQLVAQLLHRHPTCIAPGGYISSTVGANSDVHAFSLRASRGRARRCADTWRSLHSARTAWDSRKSRPPPHRTLARGRPHQRQVSVMQRSHGGHKAQSRWPCAGGAACGAHLVDGRADFQDSVLR